MHNFIYIAFWLVFGYLGYRRAQKRGLWLWKLFFIGLGMIGALIGTLAILVFYTDLSTRYPNAFDIGSLIAILLVVGSFFYFFRNYGVKKVPPATAPVAKDGPPQN